MIFGAASSSVGRASDTRSRSSGFETHAEHLVVESDLTFPNQSYGRDARFRITKILELTVQNAINITK